MGQRSLIPVLIVNTKVFFANTNHQVASNNHVVEKYSLTSMNKGNIKTSYFQNFFLEYLSLKIKSGNSCRILNSILNQAGLNLKNCKLCTYQDGIALFNLTSNTPVGKIYFAVAEENCDPTLMEPLINFKTS